MVNEQVLKYPFSTLLEHSKYAMHVPITQSHALSYEHFLFLYLSAFCLTFIHFHTPTNSSGFIILSKESLIPKTVCMPNNQPSKLIDDLLYLQSSIYRKKVILVTYIYDLVLDHYPDLTIRRSQNY